MDTKIGEHTLLIPGKNIIFFKKITDGGFIVALHGL